MATAEAKSSGSDDAAAKVDMTMRDYADADGAFALRIPQNWNMKQEPLGDGTMLNDFMEPVKGKEGGAEIQIAVVPLHHALDPAYLNDIDQLLIGLGMQTISDAGEVITQHTGPAQWNGQSIMGADVTFRRKADKVIRSGSMLALLGKSHAFLLIISAPQGDTSFKDAESYLRSFTPESGTVVSPAQNGSFDIFSNTVLSQVAASFKADLAREPKTDVLADGEPPLTYGSVVAYADMLSHIYGIELTEGEFDIMRDTFVQAYKSSDAAGRADIATWDKSSAKVLADIDSGAVPRDRAQQVFKETFQGEAAGGSAWAKGMLTAIERHDNTIATTKLPLPKFAQAAAFDNTMSEADLDSALEMFYFLWVNGGRDPSLVDESAVVGAGNAIIDGFDSSPTQLQYLLANAEQVYAGLRGQWIKASPAERRRMARQFKGDLDALGLTAGAAQNPTGIWGGYNGTAQSASAAENLVTLAGTSYHPAW